VVSVLGSSMSVLQQLIVKWRSEGVRLNPAGSPATLSKLERCLGVPLPPDIREFYSAADGMPDLEYDPRQLSFWSIDRIVSEPPRRPVSTAAGIREIGFADFLIESHYHVFRVTVDGVITIGNDIDAVDEDESFEAFVRRYLTNPASLPVIVL
jgi:hypothetical protein